MPIAKVLAALLLLALPGIGLADATTDASTDVALPEPETLALLASAAVAWAVVHWKKRK